MKQLFVRNALTFIELDDRNTEIAPTKINTIY